MTATATETPATANAEPETITAANVDQFVTDAFAAEFVRRMLADIAEHDNLVTEIKSKSTDLPTVIDAVKADTSDKTVAALQAQITDLDKQLDELVSKLTAYATDVAQKRIANNKDAKAVEAMTVKRDELHKKIKTSVTLLSSLVDKSVLDRLPTPSRLSTGGGARAGQGMGTRRLRNFTISVDGTVALLSGKSTFSAAAKVLDIPTESLQNAYMEHVGTNDADKFPATAEFTVADSKGNAHTVTFVYSKDAAE